AMRGPPAGHINHVLGNELAAGVYPADKLGACGGCAPALGPGRRRAARAARLRRVAPPARCAPGPPAADPASPHFGIFCAGTTLPDATPKISLRLDQSTDLARPLISESHRV